MSKLNAFVWWLLQHLSHCWGEGSCLATVDYWHFTLFEQERPAMLFVFGIELSLCVLELSYCGASSPVRGEGNQF